jgi:hypothetical protein
MTHPSEEDLIGYREGEATEGAAIAEHLRDCDSCRAEFARLNTELTAVFAALDTLEVPNPGEDYGQRVWKELVPQLQPKAQPQRGGAASDRAHREWWQGLMEVFSGPRRVAALASVAALVLVAFFAGRGLRDRSVPAENTAVNMQERVLLLAVGEHLGRSEMMLTELSNTEAKTGEGQLVDISMEQRRAEDLLAENRLYRETALQQGDARIASVLDELERVLLDVAHSPDEVTGPQLQAIRERIDAGGILFKVRVVGEELEERQRANPENGDKSQEQLRKDRKKA